MMNNVGVLKLVKLVLLLLTLLFDPSYAWSMIRPKSTTSNQSELKQMKFHYKFQKHVTLYMQSDPLREDHMESPTSTEFENKSRRSFMQVVSSLLLLLTTSTATFLSSSPVFASTTTTPDSKPKEFIDVSTQAPVPTGENAFITLSNGVQFKDFRVGNGGEDDVVVNSNSKIQIQCTGRLLNLNGVIFYSTKENNPDGFGPIPLSLSLGRGEVVPGLESGLLGMKKGGIRRIIVPAALGYSVNGYLEPKPSSTNDVRALDSVVKNSRRDASILFDVQLERILK